MNLKTLILMATAIVSLSVPSKSYAEEYSSYNEMLDSLPCNSYIADLNMGTSMLFAHYETCTSCLSAAIVTSTEKSVCIPDTDLRQLTENNPLLLMKQFERLMRENNLNKENKVYLTDGLMIGLAKDFDETSASVDYLIKKGIINPE